MKEHNGLKDKYDTIDRINGGSSSLVFSNGINCVINIILYYYKYHHFRKLTRKIYKDEKNKVGNVDQCNITWWLQFP